LERAAESAARREHEQRLEQLLQQEVRQAVNGQLAELRSEIAALRNELVESLSGQLRLEHTETTRIIGSDIEALQREVNQLKAARQRAELSTAPLAPLAPQAPAAPAPAPAGSWIVDSPPSPAQAPVSVQPAAAASDPFAALPRITPFTDFELDPIETTAGRHGAQDTPGPEDVIAGSAPGEQRNRARHAQSQHGGADGGGRRRSESADGNEVLARILRREAATSG
jgi:hypothetical protein